MIKRAVYTWICKDGAELSADCMVDTENKDVFNILAMPCCEEDIAKQYVTIDGKNYSTSIIDGWLCIYKD